MRDGRRCAVIIAAGYHEHVSLSYPWVSSVSSQRLLSSAVAVGLPRLLLIAMAVSAATYWSTRSTNLGFDTARYDASAYPDVSSWVDEARSPISMRAAIAFGSRAPTADQRSDDDTPPVPQNPQALRQAIEDILFQSTVPGVGVALVDRDGLQWAGGVGVADRATRTPMGADTVFRVGSISKTVIALGLLALIEDAASDLDLDTPVRDIAPELALDNPWTDTDRITIAHVLEHTAGFDDMRFNELFVAGPPDTGDRHDESLVDALARNPRSRASRWRPGSRHSYANPGYTVAAYLIERITGERFERYLERRVLRPMSMDTASFSLSPTLESRLARGYGGLSNRRAIPYRRFVHRPAGELASSPRELANLVHTLLLRGRTASGAVVSPSAIARMERGETRAFPVLDTGYGLGNYGDTSLPALTQGHNGGMPGFLSEVRYSADLGVGYVLLINAVGGDTWQTYEQIRQLLFRYLTRERTLPSPPTFEVPTEQLAAYAGFYEFNSPRHEIAGFIDRVTFGAEISLVDDQLWLELGNGMCVRLIPTAPGQFRLPGHSGPIVTFGTTADGTEVMSLADMYYERGDLSLGTHRRRALTTALWLINIGLFWNIVWLPGWLLLCTRFRMRFPLPPDALPALACACFVIMQKSFIAGADAGSLGAVGFMSLTFLVASILLPLLSALALWRSVRGLRGLAGATEEELTLDALVDASGYLTTIYTQGIQSRLYHLGTSIACTGMSVYLAYHGVIGLRTWAW